MCLHGPGHTVCNVDQTRVLDVMHRNGSTITLSPFRIGEAPKAWHRHRKFLCDGAVPAKERIARLRQTTVARRVYWAGLRPPSSDLKRRLGTLMLKLQRQIAGLHREACFLQLTRVAQAWPRLPPHPPPHIDRSTDFGSMLHRCTSTDTWPLPPRAALSRIKARSDVGTLPSVVGPGQGAWPAHM